MMEKLPERSPLDDIDNERHRNMLIDGETIRFSIVDERVGVEKMAVGLRFDGQVFRLHQFGCGTSLGVFATYAAANSEVFALTKKAGTGPRNKGRSPFFD